MTDLQTEPKSTLLSLFKHAQHLFVIYRRACGHLLISCGFTYHSRLLLSVGVQINSKILVLHIKGTLCNLDHIEVTLTTNPQGSLIHGVHSYMGFTHTQGSLIHGVHSSQGVLRFKLALTDPVREPHDLTKSN